MAPLRSRVSTTLAFQGHIAWTLLVLGTGALTAADAAPDQSGTLQVISASLLGGPGDEKVTAVAVLDDNTIVVGGSCAGAFTAGKLTPPKNATAQGFLATFTAEGNLRSLVFSEQAGTALQTGPQQRLLVRDANGAVSILATQTGKMLGTFPTGKADMAALAIDADGSVLTLVGKQLVRYDPKGKQAWAVTPQNPFGARKPLDKAVFSGSFQDGPG